MKSLIQFSKEEIVSALLRIKDKYPATFMHIFWSEINPEAYEIFLYNLGRDNDSRKSYPGLDQKQETNSRQT
jgi:hypothetical protein